MKEGDVPSELEKIDIPRNKKDIGRLCRQLAGRQVVAVFQFGGKRHLESGFAQPHYLHIGISVGEDVFIMFDKESETNATASPSVYSKKYSEQLRLKGPAILYK